MGEIKFPAGWRRTTGRCLNPAQSQTTITMNKSNFFDRLKWEEDRMLLDGHVYRLQHFEGPWTGDSNHFIFYKTRDLVDQYRTFFEERPDFSPQHIFELGLWDGGSMVFWAELFQPAKHVGVDIQNKQN